MIVRGRMLIKHRVRPNSINKKKHKRIRFGKPYNDPNITSINTGLSDKFKYSPLFNNCFADTWVKLTGYRNKDYLIAEEQTGIKHTPKITVWHHVWEENSGKYRMQLVDFDEHKKTCPHAGGIKMWRINNNKKKSLHGLQYKGYITPNAYSDIPHYYNIDSCEQEIYQEGYISKATKEVVKTKHLNLICVDMYGNLYYKKNDIIYIWDHEEDRLMPI